jgi:hypothetical protein
MSDGQGALSSTVGYSKFHNIFAEMFTNSEIFAPLQPGFGSPQLSLSIIVAKCGLPVFPGLLNL